MVVHRDIGLCIIKPHLAYTGTGNAQRSSRRGSKRQSVPPCRVMLGFPATTQLQQQQQQH